MTRREIDELVRSVRREIALLQQRAAAPPRSPAPPPEPAPRIYKRSELAADPRLAASPEVLEALRQGRIVDDTGQKFTLPPLRTSRPGMTGNGRE